MMILEKKNFCPKNQQGFPLGKIFRENFFVSDFSKNMFLGVFDPGEHDGSVIFAMEVPVQKLLRNSPWEGAKLAIFGGLYPLVCI